MFLGDLGITKDDYNTMLAQGFISEKKHPDNPSIRIANYTVKTSYWKLWNEVNLNCRGIIFDSETEKIISLPFPKFFNIGENKNEIPTSPPEITVKYDGSLGVSYQIDGKVLWATRGSFESVQSRIAQRIWNEKYYDRKVPSDITLMVEIIHPATKIVVNYNFIDLILVGARNSSNGYDFSYSDMLELAQYLHMPITELVDSNIDQVVKKCETMSSQEEGFVLRWDDGFRLKVKSTEYLRLHKVLYGLSDKAIANAWREDRINDLIIMLPEEFRLEIEQKAARLDLALQSEMSRIEEVYKGIKENSRKDFALHVMSNHLKDSKYLFLKLDGKLDSKHFRNTIAEEYEKYL